MVVPQPSGSSGGALTANSTAINLAKTLTQARANAEGDSSVVNTVFQDDKQDIGNLKGGRRRKSRKKRHRHRR